MTYWEAKIILGLREDDTIDEDGLKRYEEILLKQKSSSISKSSQNRINRELKAVKKLKEFYFER